MTDREWRQGLELRGVGEGYGRVPELTVPMRMALDAVILADGEPLSLKQFKRCGGGIFEWDRVMRRVMKRLIAEGLVEVVALGPARYRVTRLGQLARAWR